MTPTSSPRDSRGTRESFNTPQRVPKSPPRTPQEAPRSYNKLPRGSQGEDASPLFPPRLRLVHLLSPVPGQISCQAHVSNTNFKKALCRGQDLQGSIMDVPKTSQEPPRAPQEATGCPKKLPTHHASKRPQKWTMRSAKPT